MHQFNRLLRVTVTAIAAAMICLPNALAKGPGSGGGKSGGGGGGYEIIALTPVEGLTLESGVGDMNEAGDVVGYYRDAEEVAHAFCYDPAADDFQTLVGGTIAQGLNDGGEIVGEDENRGIGLYWSSAEIAPVFVLPLTDHVESRALDVNGAGIICGISAAPDGTSHAAAWIPGASGDVSSGVDLGPLPGETDTEAYRINELDGSGTAQIVGVSAGAAVVWTVELDVNDTLLVLSGPTELGTLGGESMALSVNNWGDVCGQSDSWPFLTLAGTETLPLEGLRGADFGSASDVSDAGQVVGYLCIGDKWSTGTDFRAVLWQAGEATDLNKVIGGKTDWEQLEFAHAINNAGYIAGRGNNLNFGNWTAFLLVPK